VHRHVTQFAKIAGEAPKMANKPKHPPKPAKKPKKPKPATPTTPRGTTSPTPVGHPVFSQPQPTDDPIKFVIQHGSDDDAYKTIDQLNAAHKLFPIPFPPPRGFPDETQEPTLTFDDIMGDATASQKIQSAGQLVFHSVGDTGNTSGPASQNLVADKMTSDFTDPNQADRPAFFFHLGDVIYSFGEAQYYYDQFYEPYRDYPAPIFALAGNHDGMVAPGVTTPTLQAFLDNFCQESFVVAPEAGGLSRTAQIQPGVFFTFEAPFIRILCLYSNTLEDPGVIAGGSIDDSQLTYLKAALARVKSENFEGALIIAHHHPAYTAGSKHGWSVAMLAQIDAACAAANIWPHAVLSAHAHNYQRFTRHHGDTQIPYIIAGGGGHGLSKLTTKGQSALRTPITIQTATAKTDEVVLESYDDGDYGYLRLIATADTLTIEYHPASDGAGMKTPDDTVTVTLSNRTIS
jgi:hypothetical protein